MTADVVAHHGSGKLQLLLAWLSSAVLYGKRSAVSISCKRDRNHRSRAEGLYVTERKVSDNPIANLLAGGKLNAEARRAE